MAFELPDLPFKKDQFDGFMSSEAFDYHHGKHHAAYVKKLNANIEGTGYKNKDLQTIIVDSCKEDIPAIFNNAAQHWNHSFFWNCLTPKGKGEPDRKIAELIKRDFGSFKEFKDAFTKAATTIFGSGWTWLALNQEGKLEILPLSNAGNPLTDKKTPLLTIDMWEHAFYIDHRNAKGNFVDLFWNYINWDYVNEQL